MTGDLVQDGARPLGLAGRDQQLHLAEGADVDGVERPGRFLRQHDGEAFAFEQAAQDFRLSPTEIARHGDGRFCGSHAV